MDERKMRECPICKLNEAQTVAADSFGTIITINCPRCKEFTIAHEAELLSPFLKYSSPKLSSWIRDLNERHIQVPEITLKSIKDIQAGLPDKNPREKQTIFLQNIERMTTYPGKTILLFPKYDMPLAWASAQEEFVYYITSIIERGLLRKTENRGLPHRIDGKYKIFDSLAFSVAITADGWDYLEQLERHIEERTQAFVAMSFLKDLKAIWEGPIYNAIKKSGYEPYRVDAKPHSNLIDVQIISEIKNSRFVVADFTHQSPGVYFETGYAQGMGLPVIRCVREDDFKKLHFDKNHYNFLIWKTPKDLENQLYDFICALIGKGKVA